MASFLSSYIPNVAAAVTRNADVLTYASAGNITNAAGTAYAELFTEWTVAPDYPVAIATLGNAGPLRVEASNASTTISANDGVNVVTKSSLTDMSTAVRKRAVSWSGTALTITGDGVSVTTGTFDGSFDATAIGIGVGTSGTSSWYGNIGNVKIYSRALSDAQLGAMTA